MKPILFNSEMVRAILAGRKSQTRRVVKPQPVTEDEKYQEPPEIVTDGTLYYSRLYRNVKCPYGKVGDKLWVREKWQPLYEYCNPSGGIIGACFRHMGGGRVFNDKHKNHMHIDDTYNFKPSIHMPKWACRIFLERTDIRVERVQDITEADAKAEGVKIIRSIKGAFSTHYVSEPYKEAFETLWNSIHSNPKAVKSKGLITHYVSYPWDDSGKYANKKQWYGKPHYCYPNPYVWVVEFKRIKN